jgi:hypothetical protein
MRERHSVGKPAARVRLICAAPCLTGLLLAPVSVRAQAEPAASRPVVTIPKVARPPTLEDFLEMKPSGELAGQLAKVEGFIQREPSDGQPATQRTEAYLGYDAENLYTIYVCFDSEPEKVRAHMVPRETLPRDEDVVKVTIDTFYDQRRAYEFTSNPLGVQEDAFFIEGGGLDRSFDTVWHSKGQLTAQGYVVWIAIPFKSLRFASHSRQTWGITLERWVPRLNEGVFWPHVSSRIEGWLNQEARLEGLGGISPGRNMQLIPYGVFRSFRAVDTRDEEQPRFARDRADPDAGLDAKVILNDSLVLDVAVNPDFSQVESDEPQVTVNQRFEVRFPEKRPFFLENAGYFRTPINLLFTRRIADPQFGVRLTGKLGPYALGAFVIDDESPGKSVTETDPLHGKRALFGIVRVSRDIFEQSSLGFIYTDREFEGTYNRVGGLDGRLKLGPNWVLEFQGVTSASRFLDDDELEYSAGPAYDVELSRRGRQLYYELEYNDRSPGFRSDSGFIRRVDTRSFGQRIRYSFRPEGKYLISWGPRVDTEVVFDHSGTRLDLAQDTNFALEFVGQTEVGVFYNWDRERLRPEDFEALPANQDYSRNRKGFWFETSLWRPLTVEGDYTWGTRINFAPPEDEVPVLASLSAADLSVRVRPLTPLRIDNTYLFTRLRSRENGAAIFNNHIIRSKWNWQFTRQLSLRMILQYETTLANPELTELETGKNFNADFLLTYLVNPWTALYVGYNGNAQNLDPALRLVNPPDDLDLVRPRHRFINDAKQFFVKFSYLFRF